MQKQFVGRKKDKKIVKNSQFTSSKTFNQHMGHVISDPMEKTVLQKQTKKLSEKGQLTNNVKKEVKAKSVSKAHNKKPVRSSHYGPFFTLLKKKNLSLFVNKGMVGKRIGNVQEGNLSLPSFGEKKANVASLGGSSFLKKRSLEGKMLKKYVKNRRKKEDILKVDGIIHIRASSNNTIFVITDIAGNVKDWISGGRLGLKGSGRGSSFAAELMSKWVAKQIGKYDWKLLKIYVSGFGEGRFAGIRAFSPSVLQRSRKKKSKHNFRILLVKDVTPFAYGGCRPKKRRRI